MSNVILKFLLTIKGVQAVLGLKSILHPPGEKDKGPSGPGEKDKGPSGPAEMRLGRFVAPGSKGLAKYCQQTFFLAQISLEGQ